MLLILFILCSSFFILLILREKDHVPAPCSSCSEMQDYFNTPLFGGFSMPYYRSPSMGALTDLNHVNVTTAILVVHGTLRDAWNIYCAMDSSLYAQYPTTRNNFYLVAPHFTVRSDKPPKDTIFWDNNSGWKQGDDWSLDINPQRSSFDVLDEIVRIFINKTHFPSIENVIVAGHSAGGQTIQRYSLGTTIDAEVKNNGVTLRYIVANPSSYAYLDTQRVENLPYCDANTIPGLAYTFATPSNDTITKCPLYNTWRYGLVGLNDFMSKISTSLMIDNYEVKDVVYLLGSSDICNDLINHCYDNDLDTTCEGEIEGLCRFQRGWVYYKYLQNYFKTTNGNEVHTAVSVPDIGHDACGMFGSENGRAAIFSRLQK